MITPDHAAAKHMAAIKSIKVGAHTLKVGHAPSMEKFHQIKAAAIKRGSYKGKSLEFGKGGRAALMKDRLLLEGHSEESAGKLIGAHYRAKLAERGH